MIRGKRIILRPLKNSDILCEYEYWQNLNMYGLDGVHPFAYSHECAQLLHDKSTNPDGKRDTFAIELNEEYIGNCSLRHLDAFPGTHYLGIVIGNPNYWGNGYGSECVNLLLHYGFYYLGSRKICLTTNSKNKRAISCFLSCGFIEEGRAREAKWIEGEYVDFISMGILNREYNINK